MEKEPKVAVQPDPPATQQQPQDGSLYKDSKGVIEKKPENAVQTDHPATKQQPEETINCYLHDVSEIRNAPESNRKYFNCIIQAKKKPIKAVCYSPEKRGQMQTVAKTKSPVKLNHFKRPNNNAEDIWITKFTKITPISKEQIDFQFSEELHQSTSGKPVNISSLPNLAPEQLISIKSKVVSMAPVTKQPTRYGDTSKQDLIVVDTTGQTKLVLWGEHTGTLQLNKTYDLRNVRVKAYKNERFLNTPKNDDYNATETTPFTVPVVQHDENQISKSSKVTATILGVQQVSRSIGCTSCQRRTVDIITPYKAVCSSCKLMQPPKACAVHWTLRLLVKTESTARKLHLRMNSMATKAFLQLMNPAIELQLLKEDDITSLIFENHQTSFKFVYDTLTYEVIVVEM